jgi:uncharacterized phage protein (predicted DNA packaging)
MLVTLDEIKAHLRIAGNDEDTLLNVYSGAAAEYVNAFTRRDWATVTDIPASVTAAALLLIGDLYENREAQGSAALHENRTVDRLLWPHRVW